MRVVIVWRDNTEYARDVLDWITDFERRTGKKIESIDPDNNGQSFCQTYDVVEYPSILALDDFGSLLQLWRGRPLPQIDEVANFTE